MNNKDQEIKEINAVIEQIQKSLKPKSEIGARDRAILTSLLKANKITKKPKFFKCKRDQSEKIISFFVQEKAVPKNKFSSHHQENIYLL
jgi:hypothetical protein